MCDEAMRKIEEAFLQMETVEEVAAEDQLNFVTHSVPTTSTQTPDYLLPHSEGDDDVDFKVDAYKQDNSIVLDTTGTNDLAMSPYSQPCCERQQLTSTVEAMLKSAVKSLNAFVLKQHRVFSSRKKPNIKRYKFRNICHPSFDNESLTGQWLGCKVAEKKKYDRLSLTSWRTFNRMLHQTQQSLKFFNIERRIYNVVH